MSSKFKNIHKCGYCTEKSFHYFYTYGKCGFVLISLNPHPYRTPTPLCVGTCVASLVSTFGIIDSGNLSSLSFGIY